VPEKVIVSVVAVLEAEAVSAVVKVTLPAESVIAVEASGLLRPEVVIVTERPA